MKKYDKERVTYLPGWGDLAGLHSCFYGLEIWKEEVDFRKKIESKCILAHSLGCHFALLNWKEHGNTKLILVNPLLFRKNIFVWSLRWLGFAFWEGYKNVSVKKIGTFKNVFKLVGKAKSFLNQDYFGILKNVPRENVLIVRGRKDHFFCTKKTVEEIRKMNFQVVEISKMGHVWKEKFLPYVEKEF